ncbi:nucleoside recognition domain-containing protein [Paraliobacillus sp. X-1268]|uniref:nucleoside recognition domain-containing protein n=1 Tax=Paraliobacillus sp. X-1268 TaxID=2213193 RepID=UPI000E3BAEA0|nr:nucleoside recognition domain-containing protein [Paraliobacillus sp. X-1268]
MDQYTPNEKKEDIQDAPKFGTEADTDTMVMNQQGAQDTDLTNSSDLLDQSNVRDEEFAAELTANDFNEPIASEQVKEKSEVEAKTGFGWFAVVASIVSFFLMPIFLSATGIIVGFIAKSRGADTLGNTAIIAGALSMIITLFIVPFF